MKDPITYGRVAQTLRENADRAIPDPPGLWPGIEGQLRRKAKPKLLSLALAGAGTACVLLVMAVLLLSFARDARPAAAADLLQRASSAAGFVPEGKVRHIVTTFANGDVGTEPAWRQELWLANGREHLLLWKPEMEWTLGKSIFPSSGSLLIDDDNIWMYRQGDGKVSKIPFIMPDSMGWINSQLPNRNSTEALLQKPGSRIAGTETLDGRSVVVIEGHVGTIVSGSAFEMATGAIDGYQTAEHDYRMWIDSQSYQVVQEQHYVRWNEDSPRAGEVMTTTTRIAVDELLDATAENMARFEFEAPPGALIVDEASIVRPTPEPIHTDWFLFTSDEGRFEIMMPRTPERGWNSTGTYMFGVKQGGVSYVARYRDYPANVVEGVGAEGWLDRERDDVVAQSQGQLLIEKTISSGTTPGREVRSIDPDNRLRITRLYLDGNRLYILTVHTPDRQTVPPEVAKFLDSFKILSK